MSGYMLPPWARPEVQRAVAHGIIRGAERNAVKVQAILDGETGTEKLKLRIDGIPQALAAMKERHRQRREGWTEEIRVPERRPVRQ